MFTSTQIFGSKLKKLIYKKHFKVASIARAIDAQRETVSRYVKLGINNIDPDNFRAIAKTLDLSSDKLFEEVGVPANHKSPSRYIEKLLIDRNVDADWLAVRTKFDPALVENHLGGENEPNAAHRAKYAAAFGMSLDVFERGWKTMSPIDRSFEATVDENHNGDELKDEPASEIESKKPAMSVRDLRAALRKPPSDPAAEVALLRELADRLEDQ